jgi:Tfp pilus assembly protein PilN
VSNFHHIERNIRSRFQVPVEIFNITEKIPDLARFASNLTINDKEVSLMAAVGLLLPSNTRMIDMIPPEEKMRRKYRRRIATGIVASVLILGILICATVNFYTEITRKAEYINLLNSKISEISPQVQRLESMRLKINVIEQQVGKTRTSLEFLRELYRIIPPKINLSVFLYDESKYIIIKGTSTTMADVFDLIPKLENSPYFEKVSSRGVKRRKVGKKEVVDFEIQCPLIREEEHG